MFHTTHIHLPRNRRPSALRTFITSSSFGPPDTKEPLRRGILLTAVAFVLLLIGSILTWLGFNDVFGGKMSMTGPLLIALSLLLLLLSFRQFLLARKRNTNTRSSMPLDSVNAGTVTAVVVNHDDGLHPATIIVDRYNRRGYDAPVTVHRPSEDDCAPPSYQEVTQHSSSSNTPSCATRDGQDELPPTYEETMGSSLYHHHPLYSSIALQERGGFIPASNPRSFASAGRAGSDMMSGRISERENVTGPSSTMPSIGSVFPHYTHKPPPNVMQQETVRGTGTGVPPPAPSVTVQRPAQHSLSLPPQHMSAPASPRQLSAPPSPHPFSAPPSPRQLSPHQHLTTPPQFLSPSDSSPNLSVPPSLNLLSTLPSPCPYSGPPSPLNFSAPPSPRPYSGQHSLTPPPQYTSAPPSPRQFSAPPSPLMWSSPHPQCFLSGSYPMHPLSPQPPTQAYATPPMSRHLPGPPPPHHFSTPSSLSQHPQPWVPPTNVGSSSRQDGYTCFTYNFVTPLPVETSPSTPTLYGHTSTISRPVHTHTNNPGFQGDTRSGHLLTRPLAGQGTDNPGRQPGPRGMEYQNVNNHRPGEMPQHTFPTTRTDIQANI